MKSSSETSFTMPLSGLHQLPFGPATSAWWLGAVVSVAVPDPGAEDGTGSPHTLAAKRAKTTRICRFRRDRQEIVALALKTQGVDQIAWKLTLTADRGRLSPLWSKSPSSGAVENPRLLPLGLSEN